MTKKTQNSEQSFQQNIESSRETNSKSRTGSGFFFPIVKITRLFQRSLAEHLAKSRTATVISNTLKQLGVDKRKAEEDFEVTYRNYLERKKQANASTTEVTNNLTKVTK